MAEIKNTFLKSKMNKDLDPRLVSNSEYRDALNVSVNTSETGTVGSLENIAGTLKATDFNIQPPESNNLEIIGIHEDVEKDRLYVFLTNYLDASENKDQFSLPDAEYNWPTAGLRKRRGGNHYIFSYDTISKSHSLLCKGTFLNFSKTNRIRGVDKIEDLLFWTDDRNQPRRINVETALVKGSGYYDTEAKISVAKLAPYNSPSFIKESNGPKELCLKNEKDEWLPPFASFPLFDIDNSTNTPLIKFLYSSGFLEPNTSTPMRHLLYYLGGPLAGGTVDVGPWDPFSDADYEIKVSNLDKGGDWFYLREGDYRVLSTGEAYYELSLKTTSGTQNPTSIPETWKKSDVIGFSIVNPYYKPNRQVEESLEDEFIKFSYRYVFEDNERSLMAPFSQSAFVPKNFGYFGWKDDDKAAESSVVNIMENQATAMDICLKLEDYADKLEEKFFITGIEVLVHSAKENSIKIIETLDTEDFKKGPVNDVSIFNAGSGYSQSGTFYEFISSNNGEGAMFKIVLANGEVTSVSVESDPTVAPSGVTYRGTGYKKGDYVKVPGLGGSFTDQAIIQIDEVNRYPAALSASFGDKPYIFRYTGQKPIKVVSESEFTRTSDIVPIKALTQESVGNRIIYGNFVERWDTPEALDYYVRIDDKLGLPENSVAGVQTSEAQKEFPNHSVKQDRSYQVGIVLMDKWGRTSNVILNSTTISTNNTLVGDSFFHPLQEKTNTFGWLGDSIKIDFKEIIELSKTTTSPGLYSFSNPLGWHSYKIVVQQLEQEYYNLYVPGTTSGVANLNPKTTLSATEGLTCLTWSNDTNVANIALFNDNINKLPRDLESVGPQDNIFSTDKVLKNIVKQDFYYTDHTTVTVGDPLDSMQLSSQSTSFQKIYVSLLRPFRELGEWTTSKGMDQSVLDDTKYYEGTYFYPGNDGDVDPFYLDQSANPIIATLETKERIGFYANPPVVGAEVGHQGFEANNNENFRFSNKLNVYEVQPFKSNLDLFFETSSSGRIVDLNDQISIALSQGVPNPVRGITPLTPQHAEDEPVGEEVTGLFELVDGNGTPLNVPNAVISDFRTYAGNNSNSTPATGVNAFYYLDEVVPGTPTSSPKYKIRTNRLFTSTQSIFDRKHYIEMDATDGTQTVTIGMEVNLTNREPYASKILSALPNNTEYNFWGNPINFDKPYPPQYGQCYGDLDGVSNWGTQNVIGGSYSPLEIPGATAFVGNSSWTKTFENANISSNYNTIAYIPNYNIRNGSIDQTRWGDKVKVNYLKAEVRGAIVYFGGDIYGNKDATNIGNPGTTYPDKRGTREMSYTNQGWLESYSQHIKGVVQWRSGESWLDCTQMFTMFRATINGEANSIGIYNAKKSGISAMPGKLDYGDFPQSSYGTSYCPAIHFRFKWKLIDHDGSTGTLPSEVQTFNLFIVFVRDI